VAGAFSAMAMSLKALATSFLLPVAVTVLMQ
jgi:putative effector of murein hydrolase